MAELELNESKRYLGLLVFSSFGLLTCALLAWWTWPKWRQLGACSQALDTPPTTSAEEWLTYRNDQFGLEFQYPASLKPNGGVHDGDLTVFFPTPGDQLLKDCGMFVEKPGQMIVLHVFANRSMDAEIYRNGGADPAAVKRPIAVHGETAVDITRRHEQFGQTITSRSIVFEHGGKVFVLSVATYSDKELARLFDQVVDSFRFTR